MKNFILYIFLIIAISSFTGLYPIPVTALQKNATILIHFKAIVGDEPLKFNKDYTNPFDEIYNVEKFRFYISHLRLTNSRTGKIYRSSAYDCFLIDFMDSLSTSVKIFAEPGEYDQVDFLLGVDSVSNTTGAQTGALDPIKGMFWTWNTGYVTAKLEGSSPLSSQPVHSLTYHIGGYKYPNNVSRNIQLTFSTGSLSVKQDQSYQVFISANTNAWFTGAHKISIREVPTCTTPGVLANKIADNYANMFKIIQTANQ